MLRDATGTEATLISPARANLSHECTSPTGAAIPESACYYSPGNNGYVQPQVEPANAPAFSVALAPTCNDVVTPSLDATNIADRNTTCPSGTTGGAAIVLTVSPPRPFLCGTTVAFSLAMRNGGGESAIPFEVTYPCPPEGQKPPSCSDPIPPRYCSPRPPIGGGSGPPTGGGGVGAPTMLCPKNPGGNTISYQFSKECDGHTGTFPESWSGCTKEEARKLGQLNHVNSGDGCKIL